jgi:hypothetical protein
VQARVEQQAEGLIDPSVKDDLIRQMTLELIMSHLRVAAKAVAAIRTMLG